MISDRVKKWARKFVEKRLDQYYEGPHPPERLRHEALAFAALHPNATIAEWADFTTDLAKQSWREGWVRGYENVERDPEPFRDDLPPDVIADMLDRKWRESDPVAFPEALRRVVPETLTIDELHDRQVRMMVEASAKER